MNNLSRLIQVLPNDVFGADKNRIINEAPYVALITGCDPNLQPMYDFAFGGKVEWCKHRTDAIADNKLVDIAKLFTDGKGNPKNFKIAFFATKIDITEDANQLLFKAKLVVRGYEYFDNNLLKMIVLRNQLSHNSLSEHLIDMDKATV